MKLTKKFFKENPIGELSAAEFARFGLILYSNSETDTKIKQAGLTLASESRKAGLEKDEKLLDAAETPDDYINYMRKQGDIMNRGALVSAVKKREDEIVPEILRYFYRNTIDAFLESAAAVIFASDKKYIRELFDNYKKIRSPYGRGLACLIFELSHEFDKEALTDFLYNEFVGLKSDYPNDDHYEFPLVAMRYIFESE